MSDCNDFSVRTRARAGPGATGRSFSFVGVGSQVVRSSFFGGEAVGGTPQTGVKGRSPL